MIKTKNGAVKIKGNIVEVKADFTLLLKEMRNALKGVGMSDEEAISQIDECVKLSRMTIEEIDAELEERMRKAADKLVEALCGPKLVYDSEEKSEEAEA